MVLERQHYNFFIDDSKTLTPLRSVRGYRPRLTEDKRQNFILPKFANANFFYTDSVTQRKTQQTT